MNWGDFPVPDAVHYAETLITAGAPGTIGGGQSLYFTLASVTMPWNGNLTASLMHTGYWDGAGVIGCTMYAYGTAPTTSFAGGFLESSPYGCWTTFPFMAQWLNMAKGTIISVGVQVQCNIASVVWNGSGINGSLRLNRN